jgi:hypothetical protein
MKAQEAEMHSRASQYWQDDQALAKMLDFHSQDMEQVLGGQEAEMQMISTQTKEATLQVSVWVSGHLM